MRQALRIQIFAACFTVGFSLTVANSTLGQGPPPGVGMPSNNNPKTAAQQRDLREGMLRRAEADAAAEDANKKLVQEAIAKVKEDFTRIQVVRNQIAHNLIAKAPVDYHLISTQTDEIKTRASRLKVYMLPKSPAEKSEQKEPTIDGTGMTGALVRLCKMIDSFVENPALANADTLDAKQPDKAKTEKAKADADLIGILELSGRIQKSADRLSKAP